MENYGNRNRTWRIASSFLDVSTQALRATWGWEKWASRLLGIEVQDKWPQTRLLVEFCILWHVLWKFVVIFSIIHIAWGKKKGKERKGWLVLFWLLPFSESWPNFWYFECWKLSHATPNFSNSLYVAVEIDIVLFCGYVPLTEAKSRKFIS